MNVYFDHSDRKMQNIDKRNIQEKFEKDRTCKLVKYQEISRFRCFELSACLGFGYLKFLEIVCFSP